MSLIRNALSNAFVGAGIEGPQGPPGPEGPAGPAGEPGSGGSIPIGGTTGQILAKISGTDYDTEWTDSAIAALGLKSATTVVSVSAATAPTSGQALIATSGTTATWQTLGGGLANITETLHTASPNNTVNAEQLEVTGGTTNVDLVLTPKGTGAFIVGNEPDNTTTGGNKRGANAIDIGTSIVRSSADEVASGDNAIKIGNRAKASGAASVVIGGYPFIYNPQATAAESVVVGLGTVTAQWGVAIGGRGTTVSATRGWASGFEAVANRYGMVARDSGSFASAGDSQRAAFISRNKTTTNSAVELFLDGSTTRLTIPSGKVFSGTVNIVGVKSDGTAVARYLRQVAIKNVAGTTSLVGSVITLGTDEAAGTSISITANDTNDALKIEVTGVTSETWRWVATIEGAEVAYGT